VTAGAGSYRAGVSTAAPHHRTLWEEGRKPGRLVAAASAVLVLVLVLLDLLVFRDLTLLFDIGFVLVCVAAALAVRPREFFVIGVFPPLLLAGTVAVLAVVARDAVAEPADGFLQAMVSGLAHHAGALVAGYGLTLAVLALRQVAARNAGTIRGGSRPRVAPPQDQQPRQRAAAR
jgi:uncharacterized protein DUF6542